jgi:hypothetical protein
MTENDGLALDIGGIAVFSRTHIHLSLIDSELTNICFEKEDVCALHEWI